MKKYTLSAILLISCFSRIIHAQTINTIAGGGSALPGDGLAATVASLSYVGDITMDEARNLYIADGGRIRKIDRSGIITTLAGGGSKIVVNGMTATDARLENLLGVAIDHAGNIYIAHNGRNTIEKVDASGKLYTIAGNGTYTYTGDGGPATAAGIFDPTGVGVDTSGNVYIADYGNGVVRKIDKAGIITTFAGTVTGTGGDGGPATNASLGAPNYISSDRKGNIYITNGTEIRMVNSAGIISTLAGNQLLPASYTGDGGPATDAPLAYPHSCRVDTAGNLFIADFMNNVVRKVDTKGIITTVAGNGYGAGKSTGAFSGDGGSAVLSELYYPTAAYPDVNGDLIIADAENMRIRKVNNPKDLSTPNVATTAACTLSPNPNNGDFYIAGTDLANRAIPIRITDVAGNIVYNATTTANAGKFNAHISLGNIADGTYFIATGYNASSLIFVVKR